MASTDAPTEFILTHESGTLYLATVKNNGGIILTDDSDGAVVNRFSPAQVSKIGTPEEFLIHRYLTKKSDKFWWKRLTAL